MNTSEFSELGKMLFASNLWADKSDEERAKLAIKAAKTYLRIMNDEREADRKAS